MREIKFRAWDKKLLQMINYIDSISFTIGGSIPISINSHYDLEIKNGENSGIYNRHISEVELMQFTGLKDKNGKEIYEGDLVIYCKEKGEIRWRDYRYHFFNTYLGYCGDELFDGNLEIIGNIYEN